MNKEKLVFCTLFDSRYFSRGVSMYNSLLKHCPDAILYVFAFDTKCYQALVKLDLPSLIPISLDEFEDEELMRVKTTRSPVEYCWTCTPSTVLWVLNHSDHDACTYLDADIFFYSSPSQLIESLGKKSVSIIEHRYTPQYDKSSTSGIYNVQFMTFKKDDTGLKILNWWRNACLESCELNPAEGKCGDQKYLDDWTVRFDGVHVISDLGAGVAPWNMQQYQFSKNNEVTIGTEISSGNTFPLIFFHFHALRVLSDKSLFLTSLDYDLNASVFRHIYVPYLKRLLGMGEQLQSQLGFDPHGSNISKPEPIVRRLKNFILKLISFFKSGVNTPTFNRQYKLSEFNYDLKSLK